LGKLISFFPQRPLHKGPASRSGISGRGGLSETDRHLFSFHNYGNIALLSRIRKHIQKIFNIGVYIDKHRLVTVGFPSPGAVWSPERAENDYFLIIH